MPPLHPPTLLTLPLELRHRIYSFLLPPLPTSHPLPNVGLTSVSHRPPAASLLNIHPQLSDEILDYYYAITTWKLIFSHAFNFFRVDPELKGLERSASLSKLRRVEVVYFSDILLLKDYPSLGLENFCSEIRRRASRAVDVLLSGAHSLRSVTVSWIDTTAPAVPAPSPPLLAVDPWKQKATILRPLRRLKENGRVTFRAGRVDGPPKEWLEEAMREMLELDGDAKSDAAVDENKDDPSKLRMLAFDVRQERHLVRETQQDRVLSS